MIKLMYDNNEHIITPTIFPDNTSQVWHLPEDLKLEKNCCISITWYFENESEVIHIIQLDSLLTKLKIDYRLYIPYFPYARQDKPINNDGTFSREVFINILNSTLRSSLEIFTFDIHSPLPSLFAYDTSNVFFRERFNIQADTICFPDNGAFNRYHNVLCGYLQDKNVIIFNKARDQSTGSIIDISIEEAKYIGSIKNILIIDDICDGGRTFIEATKKLKDRYKDVNVDLYVSHGIFSKGTQVLKDNGIRNIYTTDSRLNVLNDNNIKEVFKIYE